MNDNPTAWFETKTAELENGSKKKDALLDLKSAIQNSERKKLKDIGHFVCLSPIFESLNTSDSQEVELICSILLELLTEIDPKVLYEKYGGHLHTCLSHPASEVKEMVLKLLRKTVTAETVEYVMDKHAHLLIDAAGCLSSSERCAAQEAIYLFTNMGSSATGVKVLYSNLILNKLKEATQVDETSRFRVYEIVVDVAQKSPENLSASVSSGLMGDLMTEVSSSDILIQLNALELLSNLATSNHGLSYLQESRVIESLVDKLLKLNDEPLSFVLLPGLIEFFGTLYALQPEHFTKQYPQIMDLLLHSLETTDEILLGVIITTVSKIGSTRDGRLVLDKFQNLMESLFKKTGQILSTKNDLAVSVMNSLGELLKSLNDDAKLNEISKKWFESIGPDALSCIINLSKLPFVEFRLAAFSLLKAIATQQWGTDKLVSFPGLVEFLLDRSTEFNKDCKYAKYEIIYNMVQSPNIEIKITPEVLHGLKEFVREGPYFVPTQVEMATESAL